METVKEKEMIGGKDIYNVIVATFPLYVPVFLGYGSVRWWKLFTPDQCKGINTFSVFFIMPFFGFDFVSHIDPFDLNCRFLAADVVSKAITVVVLTLWAKFTTKGCYSWSITGFSLSALTNTLVVGVPLLHAMYGKVGQDLVLEFYKFLQDLHPQHLLLSGRNKENNTKMKKNKPEKQRSAWWVGSRPLLQHLVVQAYVQQAIGWFIALLFVLELRKATKGLVSHTNPPPMDSHLVSIDDKTEEAEGSDESVKDMKTSTWEVMKVVGLKVAVNPNTMQASLDSCGPSSPAALIYPIGRPSMVEAGRASVLYPLAWPDYVQSHDDKGWHFGMPSLIEGSIKILSKAGSGMAMFSIGLFMALQEKLIACGPRLTLLGMVLKFIAGPIVMAIASVTVGLKGTTLRIAIVQAALPQAIASFVYAEEYGLHPEVLSTAVIFGTLVSLPVLIAFYVALGLFH